MKKAAAVLLAVLICCAVSAGCGKQAAEEQRENLAVYSFSGENEQFAVTNGTIVLTAEQETFYGGELKEKQGELSDIAAYSVTFCIDSGGEKRVILSNRTEDLSGGTIRISGSLGRVSGSRLIRATDEELRNALYCELNTTDRNGRENEYRLRLQVTEVTGEADGAGSSAAGKG